MFARVLLGGLCAAAAVEQRGNCMSAEGSNSQVDFRNGAEPGHAGYCTKMEQRKMICYPVQCNDVTPRCSGDMRPAGDLMAECSATTTIPATSSCTSADESNAQVDFRNGAEPGHAGYCTKQEQGKMLCYPVQCHAQGAEGEPRCAGDMNAAGDVAAECVATTTMAPATKTTVGPQTTTVAPQITTTVAPQITTTVAPQITTTVAPQITTTVAPQITTTVAPATLSKCLTAVAAGEDVKFKKGAEPGHAAYCSRVKGDVTMCFPVTCGEGDEEPSCPGKAKVVGSVMIECPTESFKELIV